jgi:hypothetical protein
MNNRPVTANTSMIANNMVRKNNSIDRQPIARPMSKQMRGNNLQRVYGNIVDMAGFEDTHDRVRTLDANKRVTSATRDEKLESIYLTG